MPDSIPQVHDKVLQIFAELAPERSERLNFFSDDQPARGSIVAALRMDIQRAEDMAFHLTDFRTDAAFLVALQLYPERFTPEEIVAGVYQFIAHVPYHLAQVQEIADEPTSV